MKHLLLGFIIGVIAFCCNKVQKEGKEVSPSVRFKITTPVPEGIEVPDQLTSRIGTLKFFDDFPDDSTARSSRG